MCLVSTYEFEKSIIKTPPPPFLFSTMNPLEFIHKGMNMVDKWAKPKMLNFNCAFDLAVMTEIFSLVSDETLLYSACCLSLWRATAWRFHLNSLSRRFYLWGRTEKQAWEDFCPPKSFYPDYSRSERLNDDSSWRSCPFRAPVPLNVSV